MSTPSEVAGRYRIDRRLGAGGMSTVFLATDTVLERPVAVKLLAEHLADDPDLRDALNDGFARLFELTSEQCDEQKGQETDTETTEEPPPVTTTEEPPPQTETEAPEEQPKDDGGGQGKDKGNGKGNGGADNGGGLQVPGGDGSGGATPGDG